MKTRGVFKNLLMFALAILTGCSIRGSITAPLKPTLLSINPGKISNQSSPVFDGKGQPASVATLFSGPACSGTVLAATAVSADGIFSFRPTTPLSSDGTYLFSLKFENAGNTVCENPGSYTLDRVAPTAAFTFHTAQADPVLTFPIQFDLTFSKVVNPTTVTGSSVIQIGTATGVAWSVTDSGDHRHFTVSALAAGSYGTIIPSIPAAISTDLAGNPNTLATHPVRFHVSYGLVVLPLYEKNGGDLFDYVVNDGISRTTATDVACDGTETSYQKCLHGGEYKVAVIPGLSSCAGLTASDALSAFAWTCSVVGGKARFTTSGFKDGIGLRTILNLTGTALKSNSLTLAGSATFASAPLNWWPATAVTPLVDNSTSATMTPLLSARTIYTLAASRLSGGYLIRANKSAIVTLPGAILGYNGDGTLNCRAFDFANPIATQICLVNIVNTTDNWIEADLDGYDITHTANINLGAQAAIRLVVLNSKVRYSLWRVEFTNLKNAYINHFQSKNGIDLDGSTGSWINDLNFWGAAFSVTDSTNNHFSNVTISSSNGDSFQVMGTSSDNSFAGFVIVGPSDAAMILSGTGLANNVYSRFTLTSSYGGHDLFRDDNSSHEIFSNFAIANSGNDGLKLGGIGQNSYSQFAIFAVDGSGIQENAPNFFHGSFLLGTAGGGHVCEESASAAGLTSSCLPDGFSLASNHLSVNIAPQGAAGSVFVGAVPSDSVNTSFVGGQANYPAVVSNFDGTGFQNKFRVIQAAGDTAFPTQRGDWYTGMGQIYDVSLKAADTYLRNKSNNGSSPNATITDGTACPAWLSGNLTLTDLASTHTFLKNAYEVDGDLQGNDNGLCESGEVCIAAPNFGAYQGHGDYTSKSCVFQNGIVTGVTMYAYPSNGY